MARKRKSQQDEDEFNERVEEAFRKAKQAEERSEENVSMFEEEVPRLGVKALPELIQALGIEWDDAVLSILSEEERALSALALPTVKMVIESLRILSRQEDDIRYLFEIFMEPGSRVITGDSLARAIRHLSLRESEEKIALLLAFANDESFLELLLREKMHGDPPHIQVKSRGIDMAAFRRTFVRSSFLAANK